jgi:PAS domain S-box-containing protein
MRGDLQELEQRWALAVQSAGFGVWDLDVANQQVHYSPQWKAMLGYAAIDEADSTATWRSRVHPDDLQPMLTALTGHLAGTQTAYEIEFRLRAADGGYRWVLSRGQVVERDGDGRALRAIGTLTDLTDRHEAEVLRAERDRAEAASQAKTEFLARMSHELRTPLNAVLGFAQLLQQRSGSAGAAEQRRYAAHIEQAGWGLLRLIDNVLDLSRIETGRLDVHIGPVALAPLLRTALETAGPLAQQRQVQLHCAPLPTALVQADAGRLQQVLGHLLDNAIKFNRRSGTVTVDIVAAPSAWTLRVADTGIGIPAAQLPHLFEPFNRHGRNGGSAEGVGIGLVLVRSLLDTLAGRLAVHSTEGTGSTFEVTLPAA